MYGAQRFPRMKFFEAKLSWEAKMGKNSLDSPRENLWRGMIWNDHIFDQLKLIRQETSVTNENVNA